jgi:hypothetical protein
MPDVSDLDGLDGLDGEDIARLQQAKGETIETDAPDPTGGTDEQLAAKKAANAMGDQDAVNMGGAARYPDGADVPSAINVRRYPELFSQEVIDAYSNDFEDMTDEEREAHNAQYAVQEEPSGSLDGSNTITE